MAMKIASKDTRLPKIVRSGKIKPKIQKWHPVEMAGIWLLLNKPFYEGKDVLNADHVGQENARRNAELAAKAPQMLEELMEIMRDIEDIFYIKTGVTFLEVNGDNGWYYFSEKTAKKLKKHLLKYKQNYTK